MVEVLILAPGDVAANTNIDFPAYAKKARQLVAAIKFTGSDATVAAVASNLTVVNTTPGAGQIQLVDEDTIQLGDALTTRDLLVIVYVAKGEYSGV